MLVRGSEGGVASASRANALHPATPFPESPDFHPHKHCPALLHHFLSLRFPRLTIRPQCSLLESWSSYTLHAWREEAEAFGEVRPPLSCFRAHIRRRKRELCSWLQWCITKTSSGRASKRNSALKRVSFPLNKHVVAWPPKGWLHATALHP